MSTADTIRPIITSTYGDSGFVKASVYDVANLIDSGAFDERGREHAVMQKLWLWFPGGTTAANAAQEIEQALS